MEFQTKFMLNRGTEAPFVGELKAGTPNVSVENEIWLP
jgi:hypothetical protein